MGAMSADGKDRLKEYFIVGLAHPGRPVIFILQPQPGKFRRVEVKGSGCPPRSLSEISLSAVKGIFLCNQIENIKARSKTPETELIQPLYIDAVLAPFQLVCQPGAIVRQIAFLVPVHIFALKSEALIFRGLPFIGHFPVILG